jgi:hypothetical protein
MKKFGKYVLFLVSQHLKMLLVLRRRVCLSVVKNANFEQN